MTPFENDIAIATELPWHTNTSESTKALKEALEAIRTKAAFNSVAMLDTKMLYVVPIIVPTKFWKINWVVLLIPYA